MRENGIVTIVERYAPTPSKEHNVDFLVGNVLSFIIFTIISYLT
jgi:hypothetical protein